MKQILIFSGTTEGRELAELLAGAGISAVVCVATEYGEQTMPELPGIEVHRGRMELQKMQEFIGKREFLMIVDATHPFATEVSENIKRSAGCQGIPCFRLKRDTKREEGKTEKMVRFSACADCAEALEQTQGNILLTTGSKDLSVYCKNPDLKKRLYVRILPCEESVALCREQGLAGRQIIAMQGPFSAEMNLALLRQYDIQVLVTKESGVQGGFAEKAEAAGRKGCLLYVIGNPETQAGASFEEVCAEIELRTGIQIKGERLSVTLVGVGMGDMGTLTIAAWKAIERADYVFGAGRLLEAVCRQGTGKAGRKSYPCYQAKDMIPILEGISRAGHKEAVMLFSGDSGFYSGCEKVLQELKEWKKKQTREIELTVLPGISAVSYFAAACGISWQDAKLLSIHGRGERRVWEAELLSALQYHEKLFLLVSGVKDVREIGEILLEKKLDVCRIFLGYQLSYPEEAILECTARACRQREEEGLYILAILQEKRKNRILPPHKKDEEFLRGKVPMTKEEIRALVVCRLKLTEGAVVYDIGSGTGSVAVEIAEQAESIRVYAVEQKEEGAVLIRKNRDKFMLSNLEVISGKAPDCMEGLPPATHAFIGGSSGRLKEILEMLYRKNPEMRIVITAISIETAGEINTLLKCMAITDEEMVQVQVSRAKRTGEYRMMQAENPVFICSFTFTGNESAGI